MLQLKLNSSQAASTEVREVLEYVNENHADAISHLATATHLTEGEREYGACLSSVKQYVRGEKDSVSIPVCGSQSHKSVHAHTQKICQWRPSRTDLTAVGSRDECRGGIILCSNGLESVFGSVFVVPEDSQEVSTSRNSKHIAKVSSETPPKTGEKAIKDAIECGLLKKENLE